jgi:hypothetical protein
MRALIAINRSDLIDEVAVEFCKFYKLLDINVCLGAVSEYKVRLFFLFYSGNYRLFSIQNAVIEVLTLSPLTNKELCSLAFECQAPPDFPLVNWNVSFPDKPKPAPRPPTPPTVDDY